MKWSLPAVLWHLGCYAITLTVAIPTFTWQGFAWFIALHIAAGGGITLAAHRYFSHRTFETGWFFHRILGWMYVLSFDRCGQPICSWVTQHKAHHQHADKPGDPHSPHVGGFWWAFMGHHLYRDQQHWDIRRRDVTVDGKRVADDPFVAFIDSHGLMWLTQFLLIGFLLNWGYYQGGWPLAVSLVVWAVFVRFAFTQTLHGLLDTHNHGVWPFGYLPDTYDSKSKAVNQYLWWPLQLGNECNHNTHHAFPKAADAGTETWWKLWRWDADAAAMKTLARLGVIHQCRWLSDEQMQARKSRSNYVDAGGD